MTLDGLIGPEEAAAFCDIKTDTLLHWTESGHAPHYFYDGQGPYYKKSEIRRWAKDNFLRQVEGMPIPRRLDVICPATMMPDTGGPPIAIRSIQTLCYLPIVAGVPGVYFLCEGNEVVYVGQSMQVMGRVATHIAEGRKQFDHSRVYFIPCPVPSLRALEAHYIAALSPRYNGDPSGGFCADQGP